MRQFSWPRTDRTQPPSSRIARAFLDIALAALIIVVAVGVTLGRIVPLLGDQTYMISSGSMTPTIPVGAAVVVEPHAPITVGDVVSVRLSGTTVYTHRVTRIVAQDGETWYETKGDANREPDIALVPASAVVGRVVAAIPVVGYLLRFMSLPSGVIALLAFGCMLIVATWLLDEAEDRPRGHQPSESSTRLPAPDRSGHEDRVQANGSTTVPTGAE